MTSGLSNFENELHLDEREAVSRKVVKVQMNKVDSVSRSSVHFEVKNKKGHSNRTRRTKNDTESLRKRPVL
jgi:hypothetical protein